MIIFNFMIGSIIAAAVSFAFYDRIEHEKRVMTYRLKPGRKTYLVEPLLLPIYLAVIFIMVSIGGGASNMSEIAAACVVLFLYIGIYYAVLLCILPLLRRYISARACAALWLLPNLLYFTIYLNNLNMEPFIIITLPRQWLPVLIAIWAAGFMCVLLWQIASHMRYQHFLLHDALPVTDEKALSKWNSEQHYYEIKRNIPMLRSENTSTPVTIGCFEQTMRLVLPLQSYGEDELELIFMHELQHIRRCDTRTKALLGFCTAMCWFNPLMWIAMGRVSEDLELSCDEAVLEDSDEKTRKKYAALLLKTAGDGRGYTTCLSAKASSMRYRLKNVMEPGRRFVGGAFVGAAMLALIMGSGSIALSDTGGTVRDIIFDKAPEDIYIDHISTYRWDGALRGYSSIYGWEESPLTEYISSLHVKQVYAGSYRDDEKRRLYISYAEKDGDKVISMTRLEIYDGVLLADIPYDDYRDITYILTDEIDWDYVETLLDFDAADPDPAPQPPEMMMYFDGEINAGGEPMHAVNNILSQSCGGVDQEVTREYDPSVGGIHGAHAEQVKLSFSYAPLDDYKIKVENWERTESYYVSSHELTDNTLPLAPYSAHYTVTGSFATVRETVYEMQFVFDIKLPEE